MKGLYLLLFLFCSSLLISQDGFVVNQYNINIEIDDYGQCKVSENIQLTFNEKRRGIIRTIPLKGKFKSHRQSLNIKDVNVENFDFRSSSNGVEQKIQIGNKDIYLTGQQNYLINYTAQNGILNFENHEEIYWTLIGPEWEADIINANFNISLPKAISLSNDDLQLFSGKIGQHTSYGKISQLNEKLIQGKSLITLGKGKGLSIGIRLPKGYFFKSDTTNNQINPEKSESLNPNTGLPMPIVLLLGLLTAFGVWGRDKNETYEKVTRFYPPIGMTPSEVGTFYDNRVNDRDLISLIPKWGEEGIIEVQVMNDKDIYIHKLKDISEDRLSHEKFFFNKLFEDRKMIFIDDLKYEFYSDFNMAKSLLKKDLDPGLYDDIAVSRFHSKYIIIFGILSIIMGLLSFIIFQQIFTGIAFIILGISSFIIYNLEAKKSEKGKSIHDQLRGLYETLENLDVDEVSGVMEKDPRYLENIFPYVVAFGLEDKCAEKFSSLASKAPDWYYYDDGRSFGYRDFNRDFNTKSIGKTISIPPVADSSSSSFSGSSGGGSVGGGFGGGGGSSW